MRDYVIGSAREDGADVSLDLDTFIGGHLCVSANSGGGKSGAIRKILEATHGKIQHIILDREDEFYTLREKYDYLIAGGENGDCIANVNNAAALATTTLEAGISAIFQINSLGEEAESFVAEFLGALKDAPRSLWRPLLIVIDEAQLFAPENGGSESKSALISFMMVARKRGFTVILATPRAADLSKKATSPVNNWLLGRAGQPADRRSSADALGFTANSEEARGLRKLEARTFWAFGPALTLEPTLIKVGATETTIVKAGQATLPTPPAPAALKAMLAELNAAAADQEKEDGQAAVRSAQSVAGSNGVKGMDVATIAAAEDRGYARGIDEATARGVRAISDYWGHLLPLVSNLKIAIEELDTSHQAVFDLIEGRAEGAPDFSSLSSDTFTNITGHWDHIQQNLGRRGDTPVDYTAMKREASIAADQPSVAAAKPAPSVEGVTGPMQAVLNALATWSCFGNPTPDNTRVAFIARYSATSTSYTKARGALKSAGFIEYPMPDLLALTSAGRAIAVAEKITDIPAIIRPRLTGPEFAVFDAVVSAYPGSISNASAASRAGYSVTSTSYTKARGALKSKGLIEYPRADMLQAESWLFAASKR